MDTDDQPREQWDDQAASKSSMARRLQGTFLGAYLETRQSRYVLAFIMSLGGALCIAAVGIILIKGMNTNQLLGANSGLLYSRIIIWINVAMFFYLFANMLGGRGRQAANCAIATIMLAGGTWLLF